MELVATARGVVVCVRCDMQVVRRAATALSVCTSVRVRTVEVVTQSTVDVLALPDGRAASVKNVITLAFSTLSLDCRLSECLRLSDWVDRSGSVTRRLWSCGGLA